jgi:hypothetical protein
VKCRIGLAWSCEVSKRTVRDDGIEPSGPETLISLAGRNRRLRNIHTFFTDEVFTRMRKDNIARAWGCKSMRDVGKVVFLVVVALLTSLSLQA